MGAKPSVPRPGTRFRVIGAGMGRTGTKSFAEALEILLDGPPCDSGVPSLGGTAREQQTWLEIMQLAQRMTKTLVEEKRLDYLIAEALDGYSNSMDTPANFLTEEIMRAYPDAIVIATTRDAASWYKSYVFMKAMVEAWYMPWLMLWVPRLSFIRTWNKVRRQLFVHRLGTADLELGSLQKHEDHLRKVVPAEKLFFYKVSDGWEPLCKILQVPVPDRPFPHNNTPEEAKRVFRGVVIMGIVTWIIAASAAAAAPWVVRYLLRRYMFI